MAKPEQVELQPLADRVWAALAPELWDALPRVTYDWQRASQNLEEKLQSLFPPGPISEPLDPVERNLALRKRIALKLASAGVEELYPLFVGIVRGWGRIGGGKKGKDDPLRAWAQELEGFAPETVKRFLDKWGVERVSSWSKILAFADSERYAIYDTRVALTLNIGLRAIGDCRQFHLPVSRSKLVFRASAVLGTVDRPLGYLDYLAFLRAVVSQRAETLLSAETALFAAAPPLAAGLMSEIDSHLNQGCAISCRGS